MLGKHLALLSFAYQSNIFAGLVILENGSQFLFVLARFRVWLSISLAYLLNFVRFVVLLFSNFFFSRLLLFVSRFLRF